MNTKYKLILLYLHHIQKSKNKGMTIVFAMAIGVVMALAAGTMLLGSQAKQSQVSAENAKSEGYGMSQVAATNFINTLNQQGMRYLLLYPDKCDSTNTTNCWERATQTTNPPQFREHLASCDADTTGITGKANEVVELADRTEWRDITDPRNPNKLIGQYRLIEYSYDGTIGQAPGLGKLTIEGRKIDGTAGDYQRIGSNSKSLTQATSRVEIQIPVQPNNNNIPGLWLKSGTISTDDSYTPTNNIVQGDVWLNDCNADPETLEANGNIIGGQALQMSIDFPSLPTIPTNAYVVTELSASASNYLSQPQTPMVAGILRTFLDKALKTVIGEVALANTFDIQFPRPGDTPTDTDANGIPIYEYKVSNITNTNTININAYDTATNTRRKVIFYLEGDLNPSGGGAIYHTCPSGTACKPTDFAIYGYKATGGKICLAGTHQVEAFIFAPTYEGGVKGGGAGTDGAGIKGSLWLNKWSSDPNCRSNGNNIMVTQTGAWTDLGIELDNLPPQPSPVSKVTQKEVDPN